MKNSDPTRQELQEQISEMRERITSLEGSLAAREQQEKELAGVLDAAPVLVCVAGLDGYYRRVNAAFERILGYSEEESLSRPFTEFIHPDDHATARRHLEGLAGGNPLVNFEDRNICKDGTQRWLSWTVVPVPDTELVYGIGFDITERKQAQEALSKSQQELERRVASRTEQLAESNRRLREEIEERKQTEEALRKSEMRYRSLVESTRDYVWEVDREGIVTFVSPQVENVVGYTPEEVLGKRPLDFMEQEDPDEDVARQFHEVVASGKPFSMQHVCIHKDGRRVFIETNAVPFFDADGNQIGIWGITRDMTERRRSREQLAVFKRFAEASIQGFGMADLKGNLTYTNQALCDLFGEERPENVVGRSLLNYYPEDSREEVRTKILPALLEKGKWAGEMPILSKSGKITPTLHNPFLIRDEKGEPFCFANVITDISERKLAEKALRNSEENYRTLVETSPDGVLMTNLEGYITLASRRILDMYDGQRIEEMYGRNPLEFIVPEDHERFVANLARSIEQGVLRDVEYTLVKKDGTPFPSEISIAVVRDASGEPAALVGIIRDITERKRTEQALQQNLRQLRQMLQAQDRERQLIAYEIHDDLAQQLTAALMQFQTYEQLHSHDVKEGSECYSAGLRMLELSLAEARRLISGLRPPILDESGIVAAIGHLIHDIKAQGGPNVEFFSDVEFDRLEPLLENAIFRIVQESLTNAHRHSKTDKARIELIQKDGHVWLRVADEGVGFDPGAVDQRCFGLAGIRERARVLGGIAEIDSAPGRPTTIEVQLPIALGDVDDPIDSTD